MSAITDKLARIEAMQVPEEPVAYARTIWEHIEAYQQRITRRDAIIAKQRALLEVCGEVLECQICDNTECGIEGCLQFRALLAAIKGEGK